MHLNRVELSSLGLQERLMVCCHRHKIEEECLGTYLLLKFYAIMALHMGFRSPCEACIAINAKQKFLSRNYSHKSNIGSDEIRIFAVTCPKNANQKRT